MFPEGLEFPIDGYINAAVEWLVDVAGPTFDAFAKAMTRLLVQVEDVLRSTPWWLMLLIIGALAWTASRTWLVTLGSVLAMFLIGVLGLWDLAMQTLALMIFACVLAIVVGMPVGIALSASTRARTVVTPILDAMQTLPAFVYLIPAILLFGLGKVPAILATVIYACPPMIRLTDLGIRLVDRSVLEAADAFGATGMQKLFGVQLPLALPNIMAGINQTIMMALSMVVLASMIGARGLGEEVLLGIQRLDVGRGFAAGLAIVLLAIVLDRITQAFGRRMDVLRRKDADDGGDSLR